MSKIPNTRTGGKRGCLCKDRETYSRECCDGNVWSQGVGVTVKIVDYLLTEQRGKLLQENQSKIIL